MILNDNNLLGSHLPLLPPYRADAEWEALLFYFPIGIKNTECWIGDLNGNFLKWCFEFELLDFIT